MTIYLQTETDVKLMMTVDDETHDWILYDIVSIRLLEYCEFGASFYELVDKYGCVYDMYADEFILK